MNKRTEKESDWEKKSNIHTVQWRIARGDRPLGNEEGRKNRGEDGKIWLITTKTGPIKGHDNFWERQNCSPLRAPPLIQSCIPRSHCGTERINNKMTRND